LHALVRLKKRETGQIKQLEPSATPPWKP